MAIVYKPFKFEMPDPGKMLEIKTPDLFRPLHLGMQRDRIMLWALVGEYEGAKTVEKTFVTVATGQAISLDKHGILPKHLGTVIHGPMVWHVFGYADYWV